VIERPVYDPSTVVSVTPTSLDRRFAHTAVATVAYCTVSVMSKHRLTSWAMSHAQEPSPVATTRQQIGCKLLPV